MAGDSHSPQLLDMPAAQRPGPERKPEMTRKQAGGIAHHMQPIWQQVAFVDDDPVLRFQLAEKPDIMTRNQDQVIVISGDMAVKRFAQQAATLEVGRVACRYDGDGFTIGRWRPGTP